MPGPQLDVRAFGGTQMAVGLSALTKVQAGANGISWTFKIVAGSGTLWIAPGQSSLPAVGYPMGSSEVMNIGGPALFYLSAASATMTVGIACGFTSGYTLV